MSKKFKHVVRIPSSGPQRDEATLRWDGEEVEVEPRVPGEIHENHVVKHPRLGSAVFPCAWVEKVPVEETELEQALEEVQKSIDSARSASQHCENAYQKEGLTPGRPGWLAGTYISRLRIAREALEIIEKQIELAVEQERKEAK